MRLNRIAMWTLLRKEIARFMKVWMQTVLSPLVTTALYFLVFGVALGSRLATVPVGGREVRYMEFVVPGLMMLAMINNAFLNSASSLFQSKVNGTVSDLLTTPLGMPEIVAAYVGGAVVRGVLVGGLVWLVSGAFVGFGAASPAGLLGMSIAVTATFGLLGLCAAVVSQKFDQLNIIPSFVLTPLTFLGGVFYSASMLPEPWATAARFNPIFHMVDGLRSSVLGVGETPLWTSWSWVIGALLAALGLTVWLFGGGSRLRT